MCIGGTEGVSRGLWLRNIDLDLGSGLIYEDPIELDLVWMDR